MAIDNHDLKTTICDGKDKAIQRKYGLKQLLGRPHCKIESISNQLCSTDSIFPKSGAF